MRQAIYNLFKEGKARELKKGILGKVVLTLGIAIILYHVYTLSSGRYEIMIHRPVSLLSFLILSFLAYSFSRGGRSEKLSPGDIIPALAALSIGIYIFMNLERFLWRQPQLNPLTVPDMVFGTMLILLILEATRRIVGPVLAILAVLSLLYYGWFGVYLPGRWAHMGFSWPTVIDNMFYGTNGIWGIVTGVASTYVVLFILFGQVLLHSGGGEFFTKFANALVGRSVGGPAKVAVIASSFFGTMTGSPGANVGTTGAFTIPMMKKMGYKPQFAGAVEATASTGGCFTPPVMAGTAFIMSEISGIPYITICIASVIPSILYYMCVFWQVHFEARKLGMTGIRPEEVPPLRKTLLEGGQFLLPIIAMFLLLMWGFSPIRACLWSTGVIVLVSMVRKETRLSPRKLVAALDGTAKNMLLVMAASGCAAIIMQCVFGTGLGGTFSSTIMSVGGGSLIFALLMAMIACLILGMGVVIIAAYVLTAIMVVPAVVMLGVSPLAAHLFALFFASMSFITPPVAPTLYIAGGMAGVDPMKVGIVAVRLAVVGFIVPFMFVYRPEIIMVGNPAGIVAVLVICVIGVFFLASGLEGWILRRLSIVERAVLIGGGFCLIAPSIVANVVGFCAGGLVVFRHWQTRSRKPGTTNNQEGVQK